MKIGSYAPVNGKVENVRMFRPCQSLLITLETTANITLLQANTYRPKLNVTLQNSKTGQLATIIPFIDVWKLSEISTFNEGAVRVYNNKVYLPVMLNPLSNIRVDNDKYLEVQLMDLHADIVNVTINSFEVGESSDFVTKYNKMSVPAGVARYKFDSLDNEVLCLPSVGFDSIMLYYANGQVCQHDFTDLFYYMCQHNDVTAFNQVNDGVLLMGTVSAQVYMSMKDTFILNLKDVSTIEIIRDSSSSQSLEFITVDFIQNK